MCRLNSTPPGAAQAQPLLPCLVLLAGWLRSVRGATLGVVEPEAPGVGPHVGRRPSVRWPVWRPDAIRIMRREVGRREGEGRWSHITSYEHHGRGQNHHNTTCNSASRGTKQVKSSQVKVHNVPSQGHTVPRHKALAARSQAGRQHWGKAAPARVPHYSMCWCCSGCACGGHTKWPQRTSLPAPQETRHKQQTPARHRNARLGWVLWGVGAGSTPQGLPHLVFHCCAFRVPPYPSAQVPAVDAVAGSLRRRRVGLNTRHGLFLHFLFTFGHALWDLKNDYFCGWNKDLTIRFVCH